jgi:hypothetical protein
MVWDRRYDRSRASRELAAQEHRRRVHGRGRVLFWLVVAAVAAWISVVNRNSVSWIEQSSACVAGVICDGAVA